jgi:hypothetical protein
MTRLPLSGLASGWKEYPDYLKYVIACVQRSWDQILDQDKIEVAPGTWATVTFVLSSKGEVARVVSHTPGGDSPAIQACMTAIVTSGPYGPWTKEMVAVLGNEQKMTFAFSYQ